MADPLAHPPKVIADTGAGRKPGPCRRCGEHITPKRGGYCMPCRRIVDDELADGRRGRTLRGQTPDWLLRACTSPQTCLAKPMERCRSPTGEWRGPHAARRRGCLD